MTPERLIEIEQGVPLSDPSPYTRVIQECLDEIERLQAENARLKAENTAMYSKVIQEELARLQAVTHAEIARLRAIMEKGTK
jgi:hypothetical protein